MDGKQNASPEFAVPTNVGGAEGLGSNNHESTPARPELAPQPSASPMPAPIDPSQFAAPTPMPQALMPQVPVAPVAHTKGADDETIEKPWVNKAKAIVEATRNDPRLQSTELSKLKSTYVKTRFNKDIKVEGEAA